MKRLRTLSQKILPFVLTLLITACAEPQNDNSPDPADETLTESSDAVKNSSNGNEASVRSDEREDFRNEIRRRINKNRLDIEELKGMTDGLKKETRRDYEETVIALQQRNEALRKRMASYRGESAAEWRDFSEEFERDLDDLGKAISNLMRSDRKEKEEK